jgi:RNA recognition motif-containing protein
MKNLFVGNMSFQTTESDLRALFEPFGQVTRVHIANDRETGQPRGFAFVEMAKDEEAAKAMSDLNGKEVAGRALRVNEATPKTAGGPRGGSGFGSFGGGDKRGGGPRGGGRFSTEDYSGAARQPREPRW